MSARKKLKLSDIRLDGGTQARAKLDLAVVDDYVELLADDVDLSPVVVFFDGTSHWLADGFHRYHAHVNAGMKTIVAVVVRGSLRSAILWAVGCNDDHGLQRSNEDKRRAVGMLLDDEEWRAWSQERIAEQAHVSKSLVSKIVAERASLHGGEMKPTVRTVERAGRTYQIDTSKIGKAKVTDPAAEVDALNICGGSAPGTVRDDTGSAMPPSSRPIGSPAATQERKPAKTEEDPHDHDLDVLVEMEAMNAENLRLKRLIAADDKLVEALRWRDSHDTLERRCNEHLQTIASRDSQISFLSKQLQRVGKAVGETDTALIATVVERMVREAQEAP